MRWDGHSFKPGRITREGIKGWETERINKNL